MVALPEPDPKGVLFVTNKPAALAGLYRAASQTGMFGRILASDLFLKALVAAGRSVLSIKATLLGKRSRPSNNGFNRCALICRSRVTPIWPRNSCSIFASGTAHRLRSRAKDLHDLFSCNNSTSKLKE